jgi:hypothetical protein
MELIIWLEEIRKYSTSSPVISPTDEESADRMLHNPGDSRSTAVLD